MQTSIRLAATQRITAVARMSDGSLWSGAPVARHADERISQGHSNGFPAYRLEWQTLGSLHRRLRACFQGVRAETPVSGSAELVALELYLAWRARGLAVETPAVRR